jgi:hypothetical protein
MRWHILRALRCSDIFRSVFGDAAMGSRVRVIYEYQYDDANNTASFALPFIDNYFNNSDGSNHVATPYPVNHYFWGAGGAVYYGSGDENGIQTNIVFADSGFETPALPAGGVETNPADASWRFSGDAGIYNAAVSGLGNPPAPPDGSQAAFIQGTGAISQTVNFTTTGAYALGFQSAEPTNNINSVQFYFDDTLITPNGSYADGPSANQWVPGSFGVSAQTFSSYSTYVFQVTNPGPHTLTIQGLGIGQYDPTNTPPNNNLFIYFDDLEIASAAALFAGGIPGPGVANGQVGNAGYSVQLDAQAHYAQAYGLQVVAYEGGWSLGGDFNKTAFENWCGFYDPQAEFVNLNALNTFAQSGSRYYVFGTYETWPGYDTVNVGNFPLVQGVDAANAALPASPLNGINVPNVLTPANNSWLVNANANSDSISGTGGWFYWSVLAPQSGNFVITPGYQSGAGTVLEVDGLAASPGTTVTNFLTQGLHAIKLRSTNGALTVTNVTITQIGAPNSPTLESVIPDISQSGFVNLNWSPAASGPPAQGYLVYHGTASGNYDIAAAIGDVTNYTFDDLPENAAAYFAVVATNAAGYSLPSNELNITPVSPGANQALLVWDFLAAGGSAATDGSEASVASTSTAYGMQTSAITRGPDTPASALYAYGGLGAINSHSAASWAGANLAAATQAGSYFQFAVGALGDNRFSLSSVSYVTYQQNTTSSSTVVLEYSTNGFVSGGAALATNRPINGNWVGTTNTVSLASIAGMQNTTNSVTFRIYGYGFTPYNDHGLGQAAGHNADVAVSGSVYYPVATPSFSPTPGSYAASQLVTISTTTTGSSINYTADSTVPTESHGTLYTGPVNVASNVTLQAVAYQANFVDSAVATASYTITQQPVSLSLEKSGADLLLTWPQGTLLQATNVAGPWATNNASSPYTLSPANLQMFFRIRLQ